MISALDTTILIDALHSGGSHHSDCLKILNGSGNTCYSHALTEAFSILTGGKLGFRAPASQAASTLNEHIAPRLKIISLTPKDLLKAYSEAESRGVRGGAIYDYLHLFAARKAGAAHFRTHNTSDFLSFYRPGDPEIIGL